MARPTPTDLVNGQQAWDAVVNDNTTITFHRPLAICINEADESTELTEATLATEYAAASYADCIAWVNHTVRGKTLYRSNGSAWKIVRGATLPYERSISGVTTVQDYDDMIVCTGTTYTVTLPDAAGNDGRTLYIKRNSSGTIVIDGDGADTIDGAASISLPVNLMSAILISDGTNWFTFGGTGAFGSLLIENIAAVGSIAAGTNLAVCSGTTYTVTLPPAATVGSGKVLYVKRTSSGNITLDGSGTETIDGALTFVLRYSNQAIELVSDGTNWLIVGQSGERPVALVSQSITTTDTVGDFTDVALCTGTTYTITLAPAANVGAGRVVVIKRNSSGDLTIDGNASETIDGSLTFLMDVALMSISLYCDGSNWYLV